MIPKTFKLVNRTWMVRTVTNKQLQNHLDHHWNDLAEREDRVFAGDIKGLCDPAVARIFINKDRHTCLEEMEHTFWHELTHALLFANGENGHDEEWVDRIGGFLHQFTNTRKE